MWTWLRRVFGRERTTAYDWQCDCGKRGVTRILKTCPQTTALLLVMSDHTCPLPERRVTAIIAS